MSLYGLLLTIAWLYGWWRVIRAISLFTAMIAISYAMPAALYLLGVARVWILATMVTAPRAYRLVRSFYREVPDTAAPQTAQLTMIYGSLDAISFLVNI